MAGGIMASGQPKIGTEVFGPDGFKYSAASAASRSVDQKTGTVSGQLDSILAKDGVHMQRARSNALSMASDMGLRNSSIALSTAPGALIDRATPIATSDANIYDGASRDNMQAANAVNIANANNYNQLGGIMIQERGQSDRLDKSQAFSAGQSALDRENQSKLQSQQQTWQSGESAAERAAREKLQNQSQAWQSGESATERAEREKLQLQQQGWQSGETAAERAARLQLQQQQQGFQAQQADSDRKLQAELQSGRITADAVQQQLSRDQQLRVQQLQEGGMDKRQAESLAAQERQQRESQVFQGRENQANRDQQTEQARLERDAADKRILQQHELALKQMGFGNDLANKNIPTAKAAELAMMTTDRINQILADKDILPADKQGAIRNLIENSNATASALEKLYGTTIPKMSMPGTVAPAGTLPGGYMAPGQVMMDGDQGPRPGIMRQFGNESSR